MDQAVPGPWGVGAVEAHAQFQQGTLLPTHLLEATLQRVEQVDPVINVFATLDIPGARAAAMASDMRWHAGTALGPLDGVIVTIKDNIPVKGLPCMWGSEVFKDFTPDRDEVPVARLREAGAVILGKTNVSEFSMGRGIVSTKLRGTTRNPWNPMHTTGSSSGGAAAAVASSIGQLALGTDGGGSIRTPAAHCGLLGLKPTVGRVARAHGLPVILSGREMASPLARSAADLAAMFQVIARPHPLDASSWAFSEAAGEFRERVTARRILYFTSVGDYPVDPEITAALHDVADNLRRLGHQITEGPAPFDVTQQQRAGQMGQAGLAWLLRDREWRGRIHEYYAAQAEAGMRLTAIDYVDAAAALRDIQGQIGEAFETYDLFLSPVTGGLPGPADQPAPSHYGIFTGFANSAGVPAISIPATIGRAGLPIGFQLVGRFGADWDLISMARQYERHHPWLGQRPPL